jgi:hypothetical protein
MMQQQLTVKIHKKPEDAPHWNKDSLVRGAVITEAHIVLGGTQGGRPTVDLVFKNQAGEEFVAMITARLLATIANMVQQ